MESPLRWPWIERGRPGPMAASRDFSSLRWAWRGWVWCDAVENRDSGRLVRIPAAPEAIF